MKTITLLACIALMSFCLPNGKSEKLRILSHHRIPILEPSDMCLSTDRQTAYVVSDNGVLYHTDLMGANPQKVGPLGYDFEGVFAANGKVYVSEERTRKIIVIDEATGLQSAVYTVPYNGGRNKGIESITYNAAKKCMIAITEKSPTKLYEFNENFNVKNEIELDFFRDVSSATYFASKLWVLSDEDHSVAQTES